MTHRRFKTVWLAMWLVCIAAMTINVQAQTGQQLVDQLRGRADAPQRSADQLAEAYQQAIDYLLPLMSAEDVSARYDYQIMLQDMGSYAARPGAEPERLAMADALIRNVEHADMPDTVRQWFVLQIERIGKGESVPTLVKLMDAQDRHLRDYARRALQNNPAPSAVGALLAALAKAEDADWKIGLIGALGARRVEAAVAPIAGELDDADPRVVSAAVRALSHIGNDASIRLLTTTFENARTQLSVQAGQALVDVAQGMVRAQNNVRAARIYTALYEQASDAEMLSIRAAALNGLAVCAPQLAARQIAVCIKDENPKVRAMAVQAARQTPTTEPVEALIGMLANLEPTTQVQVLGLIADRGDRSSAEPVKDLLNSPESTVSLAAIETLGAIGGGDAAEALLAAATSGDDDTRQASIDALAAMEGPRVDDVIKDRAVSGDVATRVAAIGLLGARHVSSATALLFNYAAEQDNDISAAAFTALSDVAGADDIAALVDLLIARPTGTARSRGANTLRSVLTSVEDKDAAARIIVDRIKTSSTDSKVLLIGSLSALGGSVALAAATEAAQSSDEAMRETGIRTLSNWPQYEAASVLLAIASRSETSLAHHVLALRGIARLAATVESAPLDDRVSLCLAAMDSTRRDDEKKLLISAMGSLPSSRAADRLLQLAADENFKAEAALAAVTLAQNMLRTEQQTAMELAQKIRALNVSDEINRRADAVALGRGFRGPRGRDRR